MPDHQGYWIPSSLGLRKQLTNLSPVDLVGDGASDNIDCLVYQVLVKLCGYKEKEGGRRRKEEGEGRKVKDGGMRRKEEEEERRKEEEDEGRRKVKEGGGRRKEEGEGRRKV